MLVVAHLNNVIIFAQLFIARFGKFPPAFPRHGCTKNRSDLFLVAKRNTFLNEPFMQITAQQALIVMKQSLEQQFQSTVTDWDGFVELFSLKNLAAN